MVTIKKILNSTLFFISISILLILPSIVRAQTYSSCVNNSDPDYAECSLINLDYDQCYINNIIFDYLEIVNNVNLMTSMTIGYENSAGVYQGDLYVMTRTYQGITGWSAPSVTTPSSVIYQGQSNGTVRIEWAAVPTALIDAGQIRLRFNGTWVASSNSETFNVVRSVFLALPGTPNPSPINSNECSQINVSWSDGSALSCLSANNTYTQVYRDGVFAGAVDYGINSFSDPGPSGGFQMNADYEYSVRHVYFGNNAGNLAGNFAIIGDGRIKSTPNPPSGIEVSENRCDGVVDLTWDFVNDADGYEIFRDGILIYTSTTASNTSYEDENVVRGTIYNYTIRSYNNCGSGAFSQIETGVSPLEPSGVANTFMQELPGVGALFSWTSDPLVTGYKVERNLLGGGGASFFNVSPSDTFYQDEAIVPCQTYEYRVYSINDCAPQGIVSDSIRSVRLTPDLSTMFGPEGLQASKGYFSNRVQLNWVLDNNQNFVNAFKIYRRQLGSVEDSILITSQNSGSNLYQDNLTDAGVLYEYFIIAELQCDQETVFSNVASTIGFRSATGTITGQVSYTGGIAVEDVRLSATNSSGAVGSSLLLNGTDSLVVIDNNNFDISTALTTELWFNPSNANDYILAEKADVFSVRTSASNLIFEVFTAPGVSQSLTVANTAISVNAYNQLTATVFNDSLHIYINGISLGSSLLGASINNSTHPLVIGNGLTGNIDEFRLWSIGKDQATVTRDFSRQLNGVNPDLEVYFRLNENTGVAAYDFSRTTSSSFHKNHAVIIGNPTWSNDIPTANQLSTATYTDAQGNYFLSIPFAGIGETFVITPSYLIHNFSPSTRALFIGDGATIHNNIDFEDISSFTVQGSLFFANTSCPVEGATLKVDGSVVIENGVPALTSDFGLFNIQVPIGNHFITIEKEGHIMSVGRFPADSTYDFQDDLAAVNFIDTTLVKVLGRVVGGLKEAQYIPGLGKSTNNIGQADVTFTSQLGNGCSTATVTTDFASGEYELYLPPLNYVPTITIPSNPTINFGVLSLENLSNELTTFTEYDTLGYDSLTSVYFIDSVKYSKQIDYIYRNYPTIIVKATNLEDDFIGDTTYTFIHANGDTIVRNLKTNPFPWPVFNGIANDDPYTCLITAFENYQNLQTGSLDTVPTTDGDFIFNNQLALTPSATISLSDVNKLDTLKYIRYAFDIGRPNFNPNQSISEYSFVKTFELNLALSNGTTIPWKPDVFTGVGSPQFNSAYDQIFRAYVLGTKSDGQQFVTAGPQVPDYVLRDPPGSNSFAKREVGSTKTVDNTWSWDLGANLSAETSVYLGQKFNSGVGVAIETDILQDFSFGSETIVTGGRSGKETVTIKNLQEWSTDASSILPGKNSDLYVGKSKNVTFGISETLKLVPDSICLQIECLGDTFSNFSMGKTYGVSIVPGGYSTQFLYTEEFIKNQLIPGLLELRNVLLSDPARYTSLLPNNDPNYGLNNDDPRITGDSAIVSPQERINYLLKIYDESYNQPIVVGGLLQTVETHYQPSAATFNKWLLFSQYDDTDTLSITGDSYIYNALTLQDSLTGDSVRWINNQIKHWEDAIMLNEWEKVNIDNAGLRDIMKGAELTRLYQRYDTYIDAYNVIVAASGIAAIGTIVADAVLPGAPTTFVSFGVSSGIGITETELYAKVLEYINERELIYTRFAQTPNNFSVSSGATFSSSTTHEIVSSVQRELNMGITASMSLDLQFKVNNTGTNLNKGLKLQHNTSKGTRNTDSSTETVSFTFNDQDPGDFYSVDVHGSLLGWGPVFKLQPGGQTSCPHEDTLLTEYYIEETINSNNPTSPYFILSNATLQRDKPTLNAAPSLLTNIPVTDEAVYNLTINNESESNDTRTYKIALVSTSNPFGAIVTVDGATTFADVIIPGGSSVNKVLSVEKGPGPTYNYDSLQIAVFSECDPDQGDTTFVSAHFLPTCTEISFANPDDQWVLNNSFNDTMSIGIIDYNINFFDFNSIRLDYKPSSQSQWIGLQTFYRDTTGLNNANALEIPTNTPFTLWDWETNQLVDGDYDLRLVSQCTLADNISDTHFGLMDRINPHPFGTPSPADGILDPAEDISIRFNEPVELGSLTVLNFDVRGVINGTETNHASNLFFDGIDDYVNVTAGTPLQNRDFTLEFSVKRATTGEEAIMSQGKDANEQFYVGFDATDHLVFSINGQTVTSATTFTDNDWHYIAIAYNFENETAEMYEASGLSTASLINTGNINMFANYSGTSELVIGKDDADISPYFNGNIDEVRIWNTARSLAEFSLNKSILISPNEQGLLFNWRFDDADGILATDHVRARDAIIEGATWTVEPQGAAMLFDGTDDYLRIQKGDVNITDNMDFTLEFWFNATQSGAASIVSNGTGDGLSADSLYSWNIAKDASGIIHVYHNGEDFVATNADYFDGEWHHFALVLNRDANLTSYVDGNLENSVQALPYEQLGGAAIYFGARGYYASNVEVFDSYFAGQLDEFRLWNTARTYEQIARDKQNRMLGDEFGLKLYMPFEDYQLDPTGIALLTPGINEQIDPVLHLTSNPNGAILNAITPTIKLQRPVEGIAFTFSVNNDEIIITPTTDPALIENVTLDITVQDIQDLHGNIMQSPETWIAYMDKNQVVWQDDFAQFEIDFGTGLTFNRNIVNQGGATKDYSIENVPSWLTVTPSSGTIAPNSIVPISFEIDDFINIGNYLQDIQLLTDFGYAENLTLDVKVREEAPNWTVNPANFQYSMNIVGYLEIEGVVSTDEEDILAVFVDNEVRGSAYLQYVSSIDRYIAFLDVYSNLPAGEELKFKAWDASTGGEYIDVIPELIFTANNTVGSLLNPQLFEAGTYIVQEIPIVSGWNWISYNLLSEDSTNLDSLMISYGPTSNDELKSQTIFANFSANNFWVGKLAQPIQGVKLEEGYRLRAANAGLLTLKGAIIDPTIRDLDLSTGWNWIGFISVRNQTVTQALSNLNPSNGDLIKGQTQFAIYDSNLGWIGSLQALVPGNSYMYQSANNTTFTFPFAGAFKAASMGVEPVLDDRWPQIVGKYSTNMTHIVSLDACGLNGSETQLLGDWMLGVFDKNNECRGLSEFELNSNLLVSFMTIAGASNEALEYRILNKETGEALTAINMLTYQSNQLKGSLANPYQLQLSDKDCAELMHDNDEVSANGFKVYPTVFDQNLYVEYNADSDTNAEIKIFNSLGQLIYDDAVDMTKGKNQISIDLKKYRLGSGTYYFELTDSNKKTSRSKLVHF